MKNRFHIEYDPVLLAFVLIVLLCWLFIPDSHGQTLQQYGQFIEKWEGRENKPYKDTTGNLTVGVGHKVTDTEVVKSHYTDSEINKLLRDDTRKAIQAAKTTVKNFDQQPTKVKLILVDMAYNLGPTGLRKFEKAIDAIEKQDYDKASQELKDSKWYGQTGKRARNHVEKIKE